MGLISASLNRRIRGSLGFYVKKTEGLLYPFTMALSTGMTSTTVNFANIENKGVEFRYFGRNYSKQRLGLVFILISERIRTTRSRT